MPSHFHVYPVIAGGKTIRVTFPLLVSSSCSSHRVLEQCSTSALQAIKIQYQFQSLQCWYWQCSLYSLINWSEISRCDQISSRWSSLVLTCPFSLLCCSLQQSLHKLPGDKSRSKKSKEPKPRVKKLKYHQYIPPDQKQELNEVPMDSAYARLLQQQQQFLQLQILNQQQQQYNYHGVLPVTLKYGFIQQHKHCFYTARDRILLTLSLPSCVQA